LNAGFPAPFDAFNASDVINDVAACVGINGTAVGVPAASSTAAGSSQATGSASSGSAASSTGSSTSATPSAKSMGGKVLINLGLSAAMMVFAVVFAS
jgi:hypothetical protein